MPSIATTTSPGRAAVSIGRRTLGIGLAASVLAAGAYAYTAANTISDPGRAGDGATAISGYAVTGVQYTLATADPQLIDAVGFDLDAVASVVKAKLDASSADWTDCTSGDGISWTCDFTTDVPVVDADQLAVVATS